MHARQELGSGPPLAPRLILFGASTRISALVKTRRVTKCSSSGRVCLKETRGKNPEGPHQAKLWVPDEGSFNHISERARQRLEPGRAYMWSGCAEMTDLIYNYL